jgi:hypothetical protein
MTQIDAESLEFTENPLIGRIDVRHPEQHATMLHAS